MYVRITTVTGAANIDQGVEFAREEAEPQLRNQAGFRGMAVAADRSSDLFVVLTQWESQSALDASESAADKARADALRLVGGQVSVERYEQLLWETFRDGPRAGHKLLVRAVQMEPDRIDEHMEFFRETVLPEIQGSPGVLAVRNMVNRQDGQGRVATIWEDEDARAGFMSGTEQRRGRAEARGVHFSGDLTMDILYAGIS